MSIETKIAQWIIKALAIKVLKDAAKKPIQEFCNMMTETDKVETLAKGVAYLLVTYGSVQKLDGGKLLTIRRGPALLAAYFHASRKHVAIATGAYGKIESDVADPGDVAIATTLAAVSGNKTGYRMDGL
jgi:hypothetical protein